MFNIHKILKSWKEHPEKQFRVLAFGSSNTELHWHSLGHFNWFSWLSGSLREWVGKHIVTINLGIGGETVLDLKKRIERDVISLDPDLVIITIGGNDTWKGVTLQEYEESLAFLIEKIESINAIPVLQTYYCLLYNKMPEIFRRFPKFVEINRSLAEKRKLLLIDQYRYFSPFYEKDPQNYENMMLDGLHVNQIGNALMGIIACRTFSLPDPRFLKYRREFKNYLNLMGNYSELPSRNKRWK